MSLFLIAFIFFAGASLFSILFKKNFEEGLPIFLLVIITILYISGLFSNLSIGLYISIAFSIAGMMLFIFSLIRKSSRELTIKLIFTPGVMAFIFIFIFVYIININRYFSVWDEFSHWGVMIKETLRLNQFHSVPASVLGVHKDYPPAIQLFEYFWIKIIGSFSEANTYRAIQFFTLCLLLPAFKNLSFKNVIKFISVFVIMILIPSALGENLYNSIYIDVTTGILFAYSLYCVVSAENLSVFFGLNLFLSVFVLMITKQIGIFFVAVLLLFVVIKYLKINIIKGFKTNFKFFIEESIFAGVTALITIVAMFVADKTWGLVVSNCKVSGIQFKISDITVGGIVNVLKGNCPLYQSTTLKNFINAFFGLNPSVSYFQITFFQLIIIFTCIGFIIYLAFKHTIYSKKLLTLAFMIPISSFAYAGALLLLYIFCFGSNEGPNLASYQRYIMTYWTGLFASIFMLLSSFSTELEQSKTGKKSNPKTISWIVIALLFCAFITPNNVYSSLLPKNATTEAIPYEPQRVMAQNLEKYVNINKDKVYLIDQGSNGLTYWQIKYFDDPIKTNEGFNWSIGTKVNDADIWTKQMDSAEWSQTLIDGKYNYVYIVNDNASFRKEFGNLFESLNNLDGGIYKVNVLNKNEIKLVRINNENK